MTALRHTVAARVAVAGLSGDTADDFVLAVHELVTTPSATAAVTAT